MYKIHLDWRDLDDLEDQLLDEENKKAYEPTTRVEEKHIMTLEKDEKTGKNKKYDELVQITKRIFPTPKSVKKR